MKERLVSLKNRGLRKADLPKSVVLILGIFAYWKIVEAYAIRIGASYTDTAGFLELTNRSNILKPLQSDYFRSAHGLGLMVSTAPENICGLLPQINLGSSSFFSIHPYLIAFPLSIISWLIPVNSAVLAANLLLMSVIGGMIALAVFMRKLDVSVIGITIFILAILCYPVLSQSLLGQPYFDRLMFGPGVVLFLLLWWSKHRSVRVWKWICVDSLVLALISERGAALAVLLAVGYLILLHGRQVIAKYELRMILGTGTSVLLYLYMWQTRWQNYSAYNGMSFRSLTGEFKSIFQLPIGEMNQVFYLTSIVFVVAALFAGRGLLIVFISFLPNLLFTVGGAELTGFLTHYHQTYLPVVVAAAAVGMCRITNTAVFGHQRLSKTIVAILVGACIFFGQAMVNSIHFISAGQPDLYTSARSVWVPFSNDFKDANAGSRSRRDQLKEISDLVKSLNPSSVSAPEDLMPALFLGGMRDVEYWPVGVGKASVVVAPFRDGVPVVSPYGHAQSSIPNLELCVGQMLDTEYTLVSTLGNDVRIYLKNG